MQSRLPGFHAFRFLNLPHMQYVQEWVSVRFGFLSLHQHLHGHKNFQERVGGWLAQPPSPSPKLCFSGKRGPISQGMTLLRAHCFFCCFVVLFCFFIVFFVFVFASVFFDFFQKVSSFVWRSPIRIGDLPFRLVTCPLGRREPQHWAFFFGFTGSPRTSLFKFNVSFVFCAGFTTLSRLIFCFHVCCIWHFPFPWLHFIGLYSSHMMSPPSRLHWFLPCILRLSNVPPSKLHLLFLFFLHLQFASFQFAFCFPIFSAIVMCAPFRFAFSNSFFLHCFSCFQDVNILEQAQFDSTTLQYTKERRKT